MSSDEARLEELLKSMTNDTADADTSVMSGLDALKALQRGDEPDIIMQPDLLDMPEFSSEVDLFDMSNLSDMSDMPSLSDMLDSFDLSENPENMPGAEEEEFAFENLEGNYQDLMMPSSDMDEEVEIDFSGEANMEEEMASLENTASIEDMNLFEGFSSEGNSDDLDLASLFGSGSNEDLADIQELLDKSDNHEPVEASDENEMEELFDLFKESNLESDVQQDNMDVEDSFEEPVPEKPDKKRRFFGKKKDKKTKKSKNEEIVENELSVEGETFEDIDIFGMEREETAREELPSKKKKKSNGFFKKMGESLFGEDEEPEEKIHEFSLSDENAAVLEQLSEEDGIREGKKKGKKDKKKKDKKGKKEKVVSQEEDSAEGVEDDESSDKDDKKKKKKKEKKPRREKKVKERIQEDEKPAKKISKKKVRTVVLACLTLLALILLLKIIGMSMLEMTEARDAYFVGDYKKAYELFKGDKLKDSDKDLYEKAAVIVRLQHATETYGNHKKMGKTLEALDDLMQGISYYQSMEQGGYAEYITSDALEEYHKILEFLSQDFGLTQEDAKTILSEEDSYVYNLQLQDLANGKPYIRPGEEEKPEEKIILDDMLPEEEEYLNGSDN